VVGKFFHFHHTVLTFAVGFPSTLKDETPHQRSVPPSNGYVQNEVKKWLHAQNKCFSHEGLDKLTYSYKCINRLGDYKKKKS
jgi:hypothetical protein